MSKIHSSVAIITAYDIKSQQVEQVTLISYLAVKYQSAHRWQRAIKFNPYHLVLWSFLGLSQWVYVRDDMYNIWISVWFWYKIEEYNAPVNRIMLQNACAQSMENERLWIADVQAYICSHVKIWNNIDRSICYEVTLVCLCLNCEFNGGVAADTVTYNRCIYWTCT